MQEEVQLTYEISKSGDQHVRLVFDVKNGLPADIYLFTPLTDYRGQRFVPIPNRVYVFWEDQETLHLTKRLWPIPKGVSVYMPEVPYLTRVPMGATHHEDLQLPLPLLVNFPYRFPDAIDEASRGTVVTSPAARLVFSIGYLVSKTPGREQDIVPEKVDQNYRVGYGLANKNQVILRGKPVDLPVTAKDVK